MKNSFKILLLFLLVTSCKIEDRYYDLSQEGKEFLAYEAGDTFQLKNIETNEIISFSVESKSIEYVEDGPNESSFIFVSYSEELIEIGRILFTDNSNCYKGEIKVKADRDNGFEFTAYLYDCFGDDFYYFQNEFMDTTNVEGVEYSNAYLLRNYPKTLYYSKEKGILKIVDFDDNTLFGLIE
ncbi:hypothetical protein ACFSSB_04970 [Lacinutrix gracilariae]|uniref:Lipoprotein n=1 Tax=Lacinutrix gracilariae TaxID=1747198 RepID=A0ABW5JYE1_9FLAO